MTNKVDIGALKKMSQEQAPKPKNEDLQQLTDLVKDFRAKEKDLAEAEGLVKSVKEEIAMILEKNIPDVMSEKGIREIKLEDGTTVSVDKKLFASVSKAKIEEVYEWLKKHGFGDIVKEEVKLSFSKEEIRKIADLRQFIIHNNMGENAKDNVSINANTLSALVRSEVKNGNPLFYDTAVKKLLGVFEKNEAKIKSPK